MHSARIWYKRRAMDVLPFSLLSVETFVRALSCFSEKRILKALFKENNLEAFVVRLQFTQPRLDQNSDFAAPLPDKANTGHNNIPKFYMLYNVVLEA